MTVDRAALSAMFKDVKSAPSGAPSSGACALCKGSKMLCGKDRCPLMVKLYSQSRTRRLIDSLDLYGNSPPAVFVGRFGYPNVDVGPLVPPTLGDTSVMDTPEMWMGKTIDDIVDFRFSLVRGKHRINVTNFQSCGRMVEHTRELALSVNPIDVEAAFQKKPSGRIVLDDEVQPFGPSARLRNLSIGNPKFDQRVERAFYDTDLRAVEAVGDLYARGVLVSRIQKAFSVGAFGTERRRKFVPTRWSITAVDDILGKTLLERTKTYPTIDEFRIHDWEQLDNRWSVLFLPTTWRYELIEAWYPNTAWNPMGKRIEILSDYEMYDGRKEYAQIGGCYYAARFAVNELLSRERRQAGTIIFREAHPGYIMPVGVWNVRENVRMALRQPSLKFSSLEQALGHIGKRMDIPLSTWIRHSGILKDIIFQRRIEDYA